MEASVSTTIACLENFTNKFYREEEDPDEYPFPLTLRQKNSGMGGSPDGLPIKTNGN